MALNQDWKLRFGAQFTDQRAVGDELVANAEKKNWSTQNGAVRVQALYRELTLTDGRSRSPARATPSSRPGAASPGYLSLIDQDFDRANEKAVLVGAAYDFSKLVPPGLSAYFNFACGVGCDQPLDAGDARRPGGVRPHGRLPTSLQDPAFLQGYVAPRARRDPGPAGRQPARLAGPHHPQLGARPAVIRLDGAGTSSYPN